MRYKFTEKELDDIAKKIIIIVDTREQRNEHIIAHFEKMKIKYIIQKLDYGDYSCMLPAGSFEGQQRDIYFDRQIVIERKAHIDELAGNFKDDGVRLKTELAHFNKYNIKFCLLIEDPNFDFNIRNEKGFRSQYKPKAIYGRIASLEAQYDTFLRPIHPIITGSEIYNKFKYYVRDYFKNRNFA